MVLVYPGCLISLRYKRIIKVVEDLLKSLKLPYHILYNKCCGHPFSAYGDFKQAENKLAVLRDYILQDDVTLLSLCSTCSYYIKQEPALSKNVLDSVEFLLDHQEKLIIKKDFLNKRLSFHYPCHLLHICSDIDKKLNALFKSRHSMFFPSGKSCCGFGGAFSLKYPDISGRIVKGRVFDFLRLKIDVLATSCPACMFHVERYAGNAFRVFHIMEVFVLDL